uniref:Uncharacterized protein n=1 Tax=Plectus sambesii TaxID=2011161 RepID=A0A914UKW0_9BILA
MDQQITRELAAQTGISYDLVHFLRDEFKKFGRNPLDSSIEILAIENGLDEDAVKALYTMHAEYMRKMDGLAEQKRGMF